MSAYVVFTRTKTIDQKELEKYRTGIKATMKDHPIEVLVADGKHEASPPSPSSWTGDHLAAWEEPARRFATASPRCADPGKLPCRIRI